MSCVIILYRMDEDQALPIVPERDPSLESHDQYVQSTVAPVNSSPADPELRPSSGSAPFIPPTDLNDIYFVRLDNALKSIRLGMDVYQALLIAEFSDKEIEYLDDDPVFAKKVRFTQHIAERDILLQIHAAKDHNIPRGRTAVARWLLEHMNKERWGNTVSVKGDWEELPRLLAKPAEDKD
jgi:hypothetical protein